MALAAFGTEIAIGYPGRVARLIGHPVGWIGRIIAVFDARFNCPSAGSDKQRHMGVFAMLLLIAVVLAAALAARYLCAQLPFGWVIEIILASSLLATRSLYCHVRAVVAGLNESVESGRDALRHIVGRDVQALDEHGVSRAAIESLAESFCDAVVAPFLALVLFGLPGIAVYKAINTADSMIGHKDARHRHFGWAAARLDDAANYIPARVAGVLIILANGCRRDAWRVMWRDARNHASPNAGWPEAAMAGVLGLKLAGPVTYDGKAHDAPWIGDGRTDATVHDIVSALKRYTNACVTMLLLTIGAAWLCS